MEFGGITVGNCWNDLKNMIRAGKASVTQSMNFAREYFFGNDYIFLMLLRTAVIRKFQTTLNQTMEDNSDCLKQGLA